MRILRGRVVAGGMVGVAVLFGFSGFSWAKTVKTVRTRVHAGLHSSGKTLHAVTMTGETVVPGVMPEEVATNGASGTLDSDSDLVADSIVTLEDLPVRACRRQVLPRQVRRWPMVSRTN